MFSPPEIAQRVSLPLSTLQALVKEGAVRPSVDACGTGSRRSWSRRDLEVVYVIAGLLRAGLPKPLVRAVGRHLHALGRLEPIAIDESGRAVLAGEQSTRFHIVINSTKFLEPSHAG